MSNPLSRMTDATKQSIIESFSDLENDWYLPETRIAEMCKAIKDATKEDNWQGLHNFIQATRSAVVELQQSNRATLQITIPNPESEALRKLLEIGDKQL